MFYPGLDEILEGLQRTLERSVIPAIDDPYARAQARSVSLRLAGLAKRWESIATWAAFENAEMRAGLAASATQLEGGATAGSEGRAASLVGRIRRQLEREYPPDPPQRSPASLAAEARDLGSLMEAAILELETLQREQPSDPALAAAREAIRSVIRARAERRDPKLDSSEIQHPN